MNAIRFVLEFRSFSIVLLRYGQWIGENKENHHDFLQEDVNDKVIHLDASVTKGYFVEMARETIRLFPASRIWKRILYTSNDDKIYMLFVSTLFGQPSL